MHPLKLAFHSILGGVIGFVSALLVAGVLQIIGDFLIIPIFWGGSHDANHRWTVFTNVLLWPLGVILGILTPINEESRRQAKLREEEEKKREATESKIRCPDCKSLDTKIQRTSVKSYQTTKTEYQIHRRYDSEDHYIGYTEVAHEVPTTAYHTFSHRLCNACKHEWAN